MAKVQTTEKSVQVDVENIGGIDETSVEFEPGITVLAGRNATNRTSFLRAVMAALGSDQVSLKGDADEGTVTMRMGDDRYTRTLIRQNGTVISEGNPYLEDSELADLFAFLLESNEARRAVALDANLRELLMRPIDVEEIKAEIIRLQNEKRSVDQELNRLDELERKLTDLEQERTEIESDADDLRPKLEAATDAVEEADEAIDRSNQDQDLQDELDKLQELRSNLSDARFDIDTEEESLRSLRNQRKSLLEKRESLPESKSTNLDEIRSDIDQHRGRQRELDATISQLQNVIQFNREMLGSPNPALSALRNNDTGNADSVTDKLVTGEEVVCWTCGTEVQEGRIDEAIGKLQELRQHKAEERRELRAKLDSLKDQLSEIQSKRDERQRLKDTLDRVEQEISEREKRLEELSERETELESTVDELEEAVESRESRDTSEILERQREVSRLEFQIEQNQRRLRSVESEIDRVEERLNRRSDLTERRERIQEELEAQRTKIDRIEEESIEAFNEHMEAVLEIMEYENLDRIWIERVEGTGSNRRMSDDRRFELHVTRSTEDGTVYRDTLDHLSESEREVTGLIFALAGYLVHEVHTHVPFMILDSLEALDSERISRLLDYFSEFSPFILVALLPEDASAVDDSYQRITSI